MAGMQGSQRVSLRRPQKLHRKEQRQAVVSVDTDLHDIKPKDIIRLTSLVSKSPIPVPTDKKWGTEPSPFRMVTPSRRSPSSSSTWCWRRQHEAEIVRTQVTTEFAAPN